MFSMFLSAAGVCAWDPSIPHLHKVFTSQGMVQGCPFLALWVSMVTQSMVTNRKVVKLDFANVSAPCQGPQQRASEGVTWGLKEQYRYRFHAHDSTHSWLIRDSSDTCSAQLPVTPATRDLSPI